MEKKKQKRKKLINRVKTVKFWLFFIMYLIKYLSKLITVEIMNDNNKWISTKDKLPEPNTKVLIVRDYRKWRKGEKPYVDIATVGFLEQETQVGGPKSLSGYHNLKGVYFAVPAILHPDSVTFWREIPELPTTKNL